MRITRRRVRQLIKNELDRHDRLDEGWPAAVIAGIILGAIGAGIAGKEIVGDDTLEVRANKIEEEGLQDGFLLWKALRGLDISGSKEEEAREILERRKDDLDVLSTEFSRVLEIVEDRDADKDLEEWLQDDNMDVESDMVSQTETDRQSDLDELEREMGITRGEEVHDDTPAWIKQALDSESMRTESVETEREARISSTELKNILREIISKEENIDYEGMWLQYSDNPSEIPVEDARDMVVWRLKNQIKPMLDMGIVIGSDILNQMSSVLSLSGMDTTDIDRSAGKSSDIQMQYLITGPSSDENNGSGVLIDLESV